MLSLHTPTDWLDLDTRKIQLPVIVFRDVDEWTRPSAVKMGGDKFKRIVNTC